MLSGMEAARVVRQCEALADSERRRLRRLVPASAGKELRIQYVIESGEPRRAIARTAADAGAELIVMGVVPRNLVDIVLVGSTSGPVVRRASVPVMLVPPLPSSPATKSRSSRHVETLRHRRR
jgi:nucleotide-binding universal stress UspA family protein